MIFKLDNDTIRRLVTEHIRSQGLVPVGALSWRVQRTTDPRGDNEDMVTTEVAVRVDPELLAMRREGGQSIAKKEEGRGIAGDRCEYGNECGRIGCPNCQG